MSKYTYVKQVNSTRLITEIQAVGLSTIDHIETFGATLMISFSTSLSSSQKSSLDTVVANHLLTTTRETIDKLINDALAFGDKITRDFVAENIMLGITQLRLTKHVRVMMKDVKDAISSGSLYDTITEIKLLNPADFDATVITPARVLCFRNKIETFLNIPLATAWDDHETWFTEPE